MALVHTPQGRVECRSLPWSDLPMPHKHNADRRHHIPKMAFKVQNWPACEAGLRWRGSRFCCNVWCWLRVIHERNKVAFQGVVRNPPLSGYTGERKLPAFEVGFRLRRWPV